MKPAILLYGVMAWGLVLTGTPATAQTPPSKSEREAYTGLHAAAATGDRAALSKLILSGADVNARAGHGRTPLMVAAYQRDRDAVRSLAGRADEHVVARVGAELASAENIGGEDAAFVGQGGGDLNLLDSRQYDVLTISAVADDPAMIKLAIELGADAALVTSPYEGTALIAAAHLGHAEVCRELIKGGAPLDHVNNLNWTALIESIVLGDGGPRHVATLKSLVEAGADVNIPDGAGNTPLALAKRAGYAEMVAILKAAGARE